MPTAPPVRPAHSGWPDVTGSPSSSAALASAPSAMQSQHHGATLGPDHAAPPVHPHVRHLAVVASRPRSSSLQAMGHTFSSAPPPHPSGLASKGIAAATATGVKLKRAFGGRRKNKSEDASKLFADKDYYTDSDIAAPVSSASSSREVTPPALKRPKGAKMSLQFAQQVFSGGRKSAESRPPAPPPKPPSMQGTRLAPPPEPLQLPSANYRGSIMAVSPGITSALDYMRMDDQDTHRDEPKDKVEDKVDTDKDAWRKSDSTMSHHTIRPGAPVGTRSSRPVSMAESLQSIHTIVPVNKRLSALMSDADYATPEEDDDNSDSPSAPSTPTRPSQETSSTQAKTSPTSSLKARNRRSMSLNLGSNFAKIHVPPSAVTATLVSDNKLQYPSPSRSLDEAHPRISPPLSREIPTLTRADANGFISPSSAGLQSTGNNIRGRLAAWSATNASSSQQSLSSVPRNISANSSPARYSPTPPPSARQPTISMTGGFGLAKRAVEKMNRAWGGFSSGSSNSGHSSASSTAPSSYSDNNLTRVNSNQSGSRSGKKRRTPDAPSGAWSINSANSSISDHDAFVTPPSPYLGKQLRGAMRGKGGSGVVFGRDLKSVTRETAIGVGVQYSAVDLDKVLGQDRIGVVDKNHLQMLEKRMLPALVVRCAQHLLLWGIQEEGLFRVSGRPSHVTKLRTEFDTGADFDMTECSPGELDPHAVASIFKAFLRELPEPILTHALLPYFEAALNQETASQPAPTHQGLRAGARGPTLPSGPRVGLSLRKPPSLSTLAMPSFTGMRPPSRNLINALKSLLSQLPAENKDLIRTVVELIRATAADSKATKMPLSNLLLVFCPSLNMNPPLLKILCEAEDIWDSLPLESPVLDIKRDSAVLDISPTTAKPGPHDDSEFGVRERPSLESDRSFASASSMGERSASRPRPMGPRRPSAQNGSSGASLADSNHSPRSVDAMQSSDSKSISDSSLSEGHSMTSPTSRLGVSSPPPLSSSAESVATPSSFSANPSLTHIPFVTDPYMKAGGPNMSPTIASSSDLALNKRPIQISGPVQFPGSPERDPPSLRTRRSIPILSLPGRSSVPPSPSGSTNGTRHRMKRPSLTLLFSKRSASPLTSPQSQGSGRPYISSPYLQSHSSESSLSTPNSAVTAPSSMSSPRLTHVLDTAIDSSPLRASMGLDVSPPASPAMVEDYEVVESPSPSSGRREVLDDASSISARGALPPGTTPIADHYRSFSTTTLALDEAPSHLRPTPTRNVSSASTASTASNHLGLLDDEREDREDWTQSVLMAAEWRVPAV